MRLIYVILTLATLAACAGSATNELPEDFNADFAF